MCCITALPSPFVQEHSCLQHRLPGRLGITNESKKIIGTKPDGSQKYQTGDTHHVHPFGTGWHHDGRCLC